MDLSVAQGRLADPRTDGRLESATVTDAAPLARWLAVAVGVLLALAAFVIYMTTQTDRFYDHFVWQAEAFRDGLAAIRYPVFGTGESPGNHFFQDVLPVAPIDGVERGLLPFPPLPAVLLLPFVAVWGVLTDDQTIFTALAAIDVAICWWMLGRLRIQPVIRLATTIVFAFGTVFWYTAQLATTWYQAHILAVGLLMAAVGLAIGNDPVAQDDEPGFDDPDAPDGGPWPTAPALGLRGLFAVDAPVDHLDNVGMRKVRRRLRFAFEAPQNHGVTRELALQHLQCHRHAALLIERGVDGCHPAPPEDPIDAESPDQRATDQRLGFHPEAPGYHRSSLSTSQTTLRNDRAPVSKRALTACR